MDSEGYPEEKELRIIRKWDIKETFIRPGFSDEKGEGQEEANTCAGHDYAFHHTTQVFYCVHCGVKRYGDCG